MLFTTEHRVEFCFMRGHVASLSSRSFMVRATCSYVPSVKEFGFQRKERREIGFQVGLRPPSSTRRSAKSKGDLNSNSGTKKRREKREISDPELVGPNDPKKFNSGWLNPERNQTRGE